MHECTQDDPDDNKCLKKLRFLHFSGLSVPCERAHDQQRTLPRDGPPCSFNAVPVQFFRQNYTVKTLVI